MPITAKSADGVTHSFPDGTDGSVIDKVMKDYATKQTPVGGAPTEQPKPEEGLSRFIPSFLKGPSALEQETASQAKIDQQAQQLGRPLTLAERLKQSPATQSPIAMGFSTHQIGELPSGISKNIAAAGQNSIDTSFQRAIKPRNVLDPKTYQAKMRSGLDVILRNKPNLEFIDPKTGDRVKGEAPETVEQFESALQQTEKDIFDKYDAMTKGSTMQGIQIPLTNAQNELNTIANDRIAQQLHPNEAKYAQKKGDALRKLGQMSPTEVQQEIQKLNSQLNAFYKNPKPKGVGKASIDAMFANILRQDLDTTIENSIAPGYQQFKDEYGALATIRKDVVNRAQTLGKQEAGGGILGRIADVVSAEQVLRGLATMHLAPIGVGIGTKAWAQYVKWRRSPNKAVKNMFKTAEGMALAASPSGTQSPIIPSVPMSPFTLTQQPTALDQAVQQGGVQ